MTTTEPSGLYLDAWHEGPGFPDAADAVAICRFCVSGFYQEATGIAHSRLTPAEVASIRADPVRSVAVARAVMTEAENAWPWGKRRHEFFRRLEVPAS